MLRCFVQQNHKDWDKYVHQLVYAYNTAQHTTTKYSPFELVYGRKARLPVDLLCNGMENAEDGNDTPFTLALRVDLYATKVREFFKKVYSIVSENRDITMNKNKARYDNTISQHSFNIGDLVLLKNDAPIIRGSKKLS